MFSFPIKKKKNRMICTILTTCGQFFDRGMAKKRLDRFLVYFQVQEKRKERRVGNQEITFFFSITC